MSERRLTDAQIAEAESDLRQYGHIDQYAAEMLAELRELRAELAIAGPLLAVVALMDNGESPSAVKVHRDSMPSITPLFGHDDERALYHGRDRCRHRRGIFNDTRRGIFNDTRLVEADGLKRWMITRSCLDCGAWLSLGPATDDERTRVEVRAAEIAADLEQHGGCLMGPLEQAGFLDRPLPLRGGGTIDLTATEGARAGYLAERITNHDLEQK